jgi:hypothetical protein
MSKGLGRIEREIAREIEHMTTGQFPLPVRVTTWNVAVEFAPRTNAGMPTGWRPSAALRKAAVRAMRSFVRKHQQYALTGGKGRKQLILYDATDPVSVIWARLTVERRNHVTASEARAVQAGSASEEG